jgi:hypothetical protein
MSKRKKRIATGHRKLGISISCRVQKSVLKDLDAYRTEGASRKDVEGAVEHMFPAGDGAKGDDP